MCSHCRAESRRRQWRAPLRRWLPGAQRRARRSI